MEKTKDNKTLDQEVQKIIDINNGLDWSTIDLIQLIDNHQDLGLAFFRKFIEISAEENDIDKIDQNGYSPLLLSIYLQYFDISKYLINKGADVNIQANDKKTPLLVAIEQNNFNLVKLLINSGIHMDDVDMYGNTSLILAVGKSHLEIINLLLENGSNVNIQNKYTGETALIKAVKEYLSFDYFDIIGTEEKALQKEKEIVSELLKHGANVNIVDKRGEHAYHIIKDKEDISKLLIDNGANVEIQLNQTNELMQASKDNDIDKVRYLIGGSTDINLQNENGNTALAFAVSHNRTDIVKLLLEGGAYANGQVNDENSILLHAVLRECDDEIISLLLEYNANPTTYNQKSYSALYYAVRDNSYEKTKLLVGHGADVNSSFDTGIGGVIFALPLMRAIENKNIKIAKLLLDAGAEITYEISEPDWDGGYTYATKSLIDIAVENKDIKMIDMLINYSKYKGSNGAKNLVRILANFTKDTPIKYTTHLWDFGDLDTEYGGFEGFMEKIKTQWSGIEGELKELSSNLHRKIYDFLLNDSIEQSWSSKSDIKIGWSSLDGLAEWCDKGNKPSDFKLPKPISLDRRTVLGTFGDVIDQFKQEIEIRRDFKSLTKIIIKIKDKLGLDYNLSTCSLGVQFYTDTETLTQSLEKIFDGIKKHSDYKKIDVATSKFDNGTIELRITHIDSYSTLNAEDLLDEATDGDFSDIKRNLTNLCEWSVESSFGNDNFRINYTKDDKGDEIEILNYKPNGFTHILRFYTS